MVDVAVQASAQEIDVVADRGAERVYVQVAYLIPEKKTHEREFGNLLAIADNYPTMVVSMDETAQGHDKGIEHIHIRKFLKIVL
jgi:predicted AAA+ superfamily ATPase